MKEKKRDSFTSKKGFILACIGSAVGMGNIWLFPYRTGEFGGFTFLIPYLIFVLVLGITGVIGEMAFGRAAKSGPIGAFKKALESRGKKHGDIIGVVPVIGGLGIAIGYSVVVGWILKFLVGSLRGDIFLQKESGEYFGTVAKSFGSLNWHIIALILTFIIMTFGISKGIEKLNKIIMPLFFLLFIILAVRVFTLEGSGEGYKFLFYPKWNELANVKIWIYALGQAFFSLSLAGSGTLVYGSYLNNKEDILNSAKYVAIFDTIAAILAAIVIIPAVFVFKINPTAGPSLMFITMPDIFDKMPLGNLFAIIFFTAVFLGAISSLVNLFEAPIEALEYKFNMSRKQSVIMVALLAVGVGVFLENPDRLSTWMDIVSIYLIPIGALLAGVMFYWVYGSNFAREQIQLGRDKKIGKWLEPMSKYVFCGLTILVLTLGIFYGGIG